MVLFRKSKRAVPFRIEPEITPARYGLASENDRSPLVLWSRLTTTTRLGKSSVAVLGQLQRKLRSVVSQLLTRAELASTPKICTIQDKLYSIPPSRYATTFPNL